MTFPTIWRVSDELFSGIQGTVLLGAYFCVGFSIGLAQLPPDATMDQGVPRT